MTFDREAARAICEKYTSWKRLDLHPECAPLCVSEAADMLPAALDEIARYQERAQHWQKEYENLRFDLSPGYKIGDYDKQAKRISELEIVLSQAQRVIVESQKVENQLRDRIAELEEGRRSDARLYEASLAAMASQIMKLQDALAEERAKIIRLDENCPEGGCYSWCDLIYDSDRQIARQQLRAEGLL